MARVVNFVMVVCLACALATTTDDYGYSDPWRYDSSGYIDLGRQFVGAFKTIQ